MKIVKVGCLGFIVLFVIALVFSIIMTFKNGDEIGATPRGKIAKSLDTSPENGEQILKVFNEIGLDENVTIKHDDSLDNAHSDGEKGYRLSTSDVSNIILYMNTDGSIHSIVYADNVIYAENKVAAKLTDFYLTMSEKTGHQLMSQETIKGVLKAPSTAKFPSITDWKFKKEPDKVIIQSYVDSQNGFGAMIRSEFQFIIENGNITSLIFDGKELVK